MELGHFYLAIAVKDIRTSVEFYEKLGFTPDTRWGSIAEKWLLMENGTTRIGLFQDMFPKNLLTFSPTDARSLHKELKASGIPINMETNIDRPDGPCHFAITDPDGNTILFDQHEG